MSNESYTIEEISQLLKVSKLTVYDLVKKGELPSYRVGRQMRVDAVDLQDYKDRGKGIKAAKVQGIETDYQHMHLPQEQAQANTDQKQANLSGNRSVIISGQDVSLDILASNLDSDKAGFRPLRSYLGSLDSLIEMYKGKADIVSMHLLDGDTNEYNIAYARKILVNHPFLIINLISRRAGLYVQKGNPLKVKDWTDLARQDLSIINREKGSGARVLLDEKLRINDILSKNVRGYANEKTSHLMVAGAIASAEADIGVGIEKAAKTVGVDFIPLITERYDLAILKTPENEALINSVLQTLQSDKFKNQINSLGGYDISLTGQIMFETKN